MPLAREIISKNNQRYATPYNIHARDTIILKISSSEFRLVAPGILEPEAEGRRCTQPTAFASVSLTPENTNFRAMV